MTDAYSYFPCLTCENSTMPRQYHFVTVSKPAGSTSLTERRLIHSYATQQAYGKRRRLRMQEYQQEISKVRLGRDPSVLMADFMGPLPLNFVWANDYLVGLGRPYSSQEHFLVDHCKSIDCSSRCLRHSHCQRDLIKHCLAICIVTSNRVIDVRVVEPLAAMTCNPFNRSREHQIDLNREWLHLALTDKDLLDVAILLSACRSVLSGRPEDSTMIQLTMRYKQSGLQTLRQAIDGISLTTVDVAKAFALAIDEVRSWKLISFPVRLPKPND